MNSNSKKEMIPPVVNPDTTFVGLDISKIRLDSFVPGGLPREDANTPEGHAALIQHLRTLHCPRVICEATGGYEKAVAAALLEAGIEVCVAQPGRVRHFAQAEGLLAKTDRIDARLLARFGEKIQPRCELPADPHATRLREMLEYRRVLSDQIVAAENRLELASGYLREGLQVQIETFKSAIKQVEADIATHLSTHADLNGKAKRLRELCGAEPRRRRPARARRQVREVEGRRRGPPLRALRCGRVHRARRTAARRAGPLVARHAGPLAAG